MHFLFQAGDQVLLRSRETGKLACRATGPYVFEKYIGNLGVVALIQGKGGRKYEVSATNLLPFRGSAANRMLRYDPGWEPQEYQ